MKKEKTITFKVHRADCQCIIADIENMSLREEELGIIFEYGYKTDKESALTAIKKQHPELNIIAIKSVDVVESVYTVSVSTAVMYGNLVSWEHLGDCCGWFASDESEVISNA